MNNQEKIQIREKIKKSYGDHVPDDFKLEAYGPLTLMEVQHCMEGIDTFEEFEVCLTAKVFKKAR